MHSIAVRQFSDRQDDEPLKREQNNSPLPHQVVYDESREKGTVF